MIFSQNFIMKKLYFMIYHLDYQSFLERHQRNWPNQSINLIKTREKHEKIFISISAYFII